jgi:glycosyltransferase involved in cell wall biosynthesis
VPFGEYDSTRYLYPNKTAEYLAAGLPVLSGWMPDVERYFGKIIWIAKSKSDYIAMAEEALSKIHHRRRKLGLEYAKAHSWAKMAASVYGHYAKAYRKARRTNRAQPQSKQRLALAA